MRVVIVCTSDRDGKPTERTIEEIPFSLARLGQRRRTGRPPGDPRKIASFAKITRAANSARPWRSTLRGL
jgi:hypothetical protein